MYAQNSTCEVIEASFQQSVPCYPVNMTARVIFIPFESKALASYVPEKVEWITGECPALNGFEVTFTMSMDAKIAEEIEVLKRIKQAERKQEIGGLISFDFELKIKPWQLIGISWEFFEEQENG
ncbi:hypothetical protein AVEN_146290-1 [Araneus ventricosus]|uniref:Uncharacterized protein n=1 Tax=Araneus ventricosus TaxID=182803 RepID=A0A4Y2HM50_ARAVE|nr:hypothetical protein AVEN_146290-1 [Araneus ventricosus]